MILVILYIGAGLYMWLMLLGVLHREYMKTFNRARKWGLATMATGFIMLGVATAYYYASELEKLSGEQSKAKQEQPASPNRMEGPSTGKGDRSP